MSSYKVEPTKFRGQRFAEEFEKRFTNDLAILKVAWVWKEANRPPAVPAKLLKASTTRKLAAITGGNPELCALIGINANAQVRAAAVPDNLDQDDVDNWLQVVEDRTPATPRRRNIGLEL